MWVCYKRAFLLKVFALMTFLALLDQTFLLGVLYPLNPSYPIGLECPERLRAEGTLVRPTKTSGNEIRMDPKIRSCCADRQAGDPLAAHMAD